LTEVTGQAGAIQPFDTGMVTDLDIVDEFAYSDNDTSTFVTSDER
jgi:hypothetical protein